ncbi:hypothetical protein ACFUCV_02235 [Specibacter sp. NPDC057265]|uniref:hypothetical protein n=1 Tax=Specibacter sp. NPDC057265 TaxID=3346075 RepID=UPI0036251258
MTAPTPPAQQQLLVPDARFSLAELHAMKLDGVLRHLDGTVFVPAGMPETVELRAAALAVQVPASLARRAIVAQLSAAWVYGCAPPPSPLALFLMPGGKSAQLPPFSGCSLRELQLAAHDVWELAGCCVTSPVRTAVDVARSAPLPLAGQVLAALMGHEELDCGRDRVLAALLAMRHVPGRTRALELVRQPGGA